MNSPAAFRAAYADWKNIKTRGVVQIVFEVPLADSDAAYEILGGMPNPAKERWFGIAALKSPAEEARAKPDQEIPHHTRPDRAAREKMDWRDVQPAAQAGIRCAEPVFVAFLKDQYPVAWREFPEAAACVRYLCYVESRKELGTNHRARVIWKQLDDKFQEWLAKERVGA